MHTCQQLSPVEEACALLGSFARDLDSWNLHCIATAHEKFSGVMAALAKEQAVAKVEQWLDHHNMRADTCQRLTRALHDLDMGVAWGGNWRERMLALAEQAIIQARENTHTHKIVAKVAQRLEDSQLSDLELRTSVGVLCLCADSRLPYPPMRELPQVSLSAFDLHASQYWELERHCGVLVIPRSLCGPRFGIALDVGYASGVCVPHEAAIVPVGASSHTIYHELVHACQQFTEPQLSSLSNAERLPFYALLEGITETLAQVASGAVDLTISYSKCARFVKTLAAQADAERAPDVIVASWIREPGVDLVERISIATGLEVEELMRRTIQACGSEVSSYTSHTCERRF